MCARLVCVCLVEVMASLFATPIKALPFHFPEQESFNRAKTQKKKNGKHQKRTKTKMSLKKVSLAKVKKLLRGSEDKAFRVEKSVETLVGSI